MHVGRVRTRRSFAALRQRGARGRDGVVQVTFVPGEDDRVNAAYAVGRGTGTAVVRNRVKRRLRAALAELSPPPGTYLIGAGSGAGDLSYQALRGHLAAAITAATRGVA